MQQAKRAQMKRAGGSDKTAIAELYDIRHKYSDDKNVMSACDCTCLLILGEKQPFLRKAIWEDAHKALAQVKMSKWLESRLQSLYKEIGHEHKT